MQISLKKNLIHSIAIRNTELHAAMKIKWHVRRGVFLGLNHVCRPRVNRDKNDIKDS